MANLLSPDAYWRTFSEYNDPRYQDDGAWTNFQRQQGINFPTSSLLNLSGSDQGYLINPENKQSYLAYNPAYFTEGNFYGNSDLFNQFNNVLQSQMITQDGQQYVPSSLYESAEQAMQPMSRSARSNWSTGLGDFLNSYGPLVVGAGLAAAAAPAIGAAGAAGTGATEGALGAGAELFGPSALELGVPGATGYAAPYAAGAAGLGASGGLMGPSAAELGVPGASGYAAPAASGVSAAANGFKIPGTDITIPGNVLAGGLQGLLGYLGAGQQSDAFENVANQQSAIGAPYRDLLLQSYQPGFDLMSQPGYGDAFSRIADISERANSARYGNTADSNTARAGIMSDVWNQGYLPALNSYRGGLGQFGGLGLNQSGTASLMGAQNSGGALDALGYGAATIFNPSPSWQDLLKQTGVNNFSLNIGGNTWGR